jgi:outer membrane protein OmpA-like peptidoglycan-associated protein
MATGPPKKEKQSIVWITALGLVVVAVGTFWLWSNTHRTQLGPAAPAPGVANRLAGEAPATSGAPQFASTSDTDGHPLSNLDNLRFASGPSVLPSDASAQMDRIAGMMKADPDLHLTISGFTDDGGSASERLRISRSRADSVKNALVARGIARDRIATEAFGSENPIADNATAEGRAKNRRVSMRVTLY